MTADQAREKVRVLDPGLDEDDEAFGAAEAMLYAVGNDTHDIYTVAGATGRPRWQVSRWFGRLRGGQVFRGLPNTAEFDIEPWFDKASGGVAFWADVLVATGHLRRQPVPHDSAVPETSGPRNG